MTMRLLIGSRLVDGDQRLEVINPATEETAAVCPRASPQQLEAAIAAARAAFPAWAALDPAERSAAVSRAADAIEPHMDELARLLTLEQGKPLADALDEVGFVIHAFRSLAYSKPEETREEASRRIRIRRRPLGVVGVIVPWNYPLAMVAAKAPFALLTGNTIVVKPAPTTPLATVRLGEILQNALPPGVVNVIVDDGDLGPLMTQHPGLAKISFTGSTATGRRVMSSAAGTLKRITLELGGNDAGIVLEDADPASVAPDIFASAFRNSGQVCVALKRLYVHDAIYDAMCDSLAALAEAVVVGDGLEPGAELGPVQNSAQRDKVASIIEESRRLGRVIAGDGPKPEKGYFIRPTLVRDIAEGARLVDEEQFGPALPIIRYSGADEVIERANASPYGLGGSIWSGDLARANAVAERLECGTVWINKHGELDPGVPFAGAKQSGLGVEFGAEGFAEFTQLQVINAAR